MTTETVNIRTRMPVLLVKRLNAESSRHGVSRQDYLVEAVQQRLTGPRKPSGVPAGPQVFARAVEDASRVSAGLPRTQLEAIVAAVICSLDRMTGKAADA